MCLGNCVGFFERRALKLLVAGLAAGAHCQQPAGRFAAVRSPLVFGLPDPPVSANAECQLQLCHSETP